MFTNLRTNLVTALASLQMNDFPHVVLKIFFFKFIWKIKINIFWIFFHS